MIETINKLSSTFVMTLIKVEHFEAWGNKFVQHLKWCHTYDAKSFALYFHCVYWHCCVDI